MNQVSFHQVFEALSGTGPFPWLYTLYDDWFATGRIPGVCRIPTGLGKTSVIAVWLIALANQPDKMPRRLVYVVNRRTVVDQTTDVVEELWRNLTRPELSRMKERLGGSLAISTLRGQFADNREWSADPSRPAVIAGTVDMIGSRLLFSGYGIGFRSKPLHAGFLGQDVLLVHDEAHLEPAFQCLIEQIAEEQKKEPAPLGMHKRLRIMALTATSRAAGEEFTLTPGDYEHPEVRKRIQATKLLRLHEIEDEKKLADRVVELALAHEDCKQTVLVFLRAVNDVEKVVNKLPKGRRQQLTGTIRGYERDKLVSDDPIFRRFLPKAAAGDQTVYLVCTSAGEVGVNISADHMVCDLSTFESMAQRLGRVNRFGDCDNTQVDVVHPAKFGKDDEYDARRQRTLQLLRDLGGDASPAALDRLDAKARQDAFAPTPIMLPLSDILFDAWTLTTIREPLPGRPLVDPYLHGISERELPETYVAWREEVGRITGELLDQYPPEELLEDYPLKPHELLRDRSDRVNKHLVEIAARHPEAPVWLLDEHGKVDVVTLKKLTQASKDRINYRTVLLPPEVGGLQETGLLDGSSAEPATDIADEWFADSEKKNRNRVRLWIGDAPLGMRLVRRIILPAVEQDDEAVERTWLWYVRPKVADDDGSKSALKPVSLTVHTLDVCNEVTKIVERLGLPTDLRGALIAASQLHDLGKGRELWQRSIGNPRPNDPEHWLAKSGDGMVPRETTDYRHEFGSLLDVEGRDEFKALPPELQELVRHLVAAHHGYGRPHFPSDRAFDPEPKGRDVAAAADAVPRRFAYLQRRYGRWGLAFLESILRAADYAASAHPSGTVEVKYE